MICYRAVLLVVLLAGFPGTALGADASWKAGTARAVITPEQSMWMAGYGGRDRPSEGKRTELWAKALVLEDAAGERGLLLSLDLVGIDRSLSLAICQDLQQQYGLERKQIALCTSHTHTGPVVGHNLAPLHRELLSPPQQQQIDAYADGLQATIVKIVGQALDDLAPCRLQHGTGQATFAVNRRENVPEAEVPSLRVQNALAGPIDHDVPVLAVTAQDGSLKAVVFGYACHATVLSDYQWSGDYPGFAQMELERLHPECQAMFWAGCGADQNPLPRRSAELAEHYGRRLATAVEAVLLTTQMADIAPELQTSYAEIPLQLTAVPTREMLAQSAQSNDRYEQARARILLTQLDKGQPLAETYPYPVGLWKLGPELSWCFLGGEVVVDYALQLKHAFPDGTLWVAGYANDVMAYIPSRRVLQEGGYEGGGSMVYYGLPSLWDPAIEAGIHDEVRRQMDHKEDARHASPAGER